MRISRRKILYGMGAGAITGAALPSLAASYLYGVAPAAGAGAAGRPIRFDRNENPYGPPESAMAAMRENLGRANRYPDVGRALEAKIAAFHKVKPEQVLLGCGSSEILRMTADAFLHPGRKLVTATPSFPLLDFYARDNGAEVVDVPLTGDRAHDLKAMLARCDGSTGLVHICNPNNPTGTLTVRQEIEDFLRKLPPSIPVIIDEAYHHYVSPSAPYASFIDRPIGDSRVIVARTFSKIYALAGLRIGYAVASAEMAEKIGASWLQFSVNALAIQAAMAALEDIEHLQRNAAANAEQRQEFLKQAKARGMNTIESQTNFALLQVDRSIDDIMAHFRKSNLLVGPHFPGIDGFLRVSFGRPEEMVAFWRVWDTLPRKA
ncbi:MAG: aminotransferase class I/II-fold pyridoxal phosphate-dependent enzyme [Acidobacteriia bacterium]|nr:aminotransferase class I/II-fold pyridoxal phosphate-dependent enzyme [Terriglobia bacterium]